MLKKLVLSIFNKISGILSGCHLGQFYPVKLVYNFIRSRLKSTLAEVDGHKMFLDSKDSLNLSIRGFYEPVETGLVKREIRRGDVVVDIGANIGYYTLIFARLVGEKGRVFAFEPDPANFALLAKNVAVNGYRNVELIPKAVSDRTANARLYLSSRSTVDHRIYSSNDNRKFVDVEAVRLDDYFQNTGGKIDFIKMDIQGAEGKAVRGMLDLLKRHPGIKLAMEFQPLGIKTAGMEPEDCLRLLVACGFRIFEISERRRTIKPADMADLLKRYTPEKKNYTNIYCVKS